MAVSEFTSGPLRELSARELGTDSFSDFELLSDSGHNCVYRAMSGGKWVVLKVAKEEEGNTARNRLLLQREYDIMHAIDCLYVVKTWQMTEVPELGTAIVMEYVNGRTLDAFLREKPSFAERKRVAEELMEALQSLHERQIVHGDLKGTNILIAEAGNHVRLIDFGFADTDAHIAKNIGTSPSIQPSESISSLPTESADIQRDIYAFGKILSLLFPHRFRIVRNRCLRGRYTSMREVRKALHRHALCQWLLPILSLIAIGIIGFVCRPQNDATEPILTIQKDTVVIAMPIMEPQVDSTWLKIKMRAEREYKALYRLYADSLKNMPEPELGAAIQMSNRYAAQMLAKRDRLAAAYPKYEEQLMQQYSNTYIRDLPRLEAIYKDYPIIIRK